MRVCENQSSVKSRDEVEAFLCDVNRCIDAGDCTINNQPWKGNKVNKTLNYLTERNLKDEDVFQVVRELKVDNYSYTESDRNSNFENEVCWFFGIKVNLVDVDENLYIKLKLRTFTNGKLLLVMSFHPEMPRRGAKKLTFPYAR